MIKIANLHDWTTENIGYLGKSRYITTHVDPGTDDSEKVLKVATHLFSLTATYLEDHNLEHHFMIVLPLVTYESDEILLKAPKNYRELLTEIDKNTSPIVYIFRPDLDSFRSITEEYKTPLGFRIDNLDKDSSIVFYREFRFEQAIAEKWEYSRDICFRYYLKKYR